MEVVELPIEALKEAPWNANQIDAAMLQRLRSSILKYGFIQNLVVRQIASGYEVLSGNQRLKLLHEFNIRMFLVSSSIWMMPMPGSLPRYLIILTDPMTWGYGQNSSAK